MYKLVLWSGLGVHSWILFEEAKSEDAFPPLMGVQPIGPDQSKARSEVRRVSTSDPQTKCSALVTIFHFMIPLVNENTGCTKKKPPNPKQTLSLQGNGVPQSS